MRARRLAAAPQADSELTLDQLRHGQHAVVLGYSDQVEPVTARRLFDLGIVPGIEVTMVRRAPLRDPVIFQVGDYEIALRDAQSRHITVERVG
jgi:ferrous iron transport protein A